MTRRTRITLPPLDSGQALAVVGVLERAIAAIWSIHGDAMADHLAMLGLDTPQPPDAITSKAQPRDDIPF